MQEGIKSSILSQEQREEQNLQERIRAAFDQLETDDERGLLAYYAVFSGKLIQPEYVELALRQFEKIKIKDISETAEWLKEKFAPFNLPEDRQQQIAQNIKKYNESYEKS